MKVPAQKPVVIHFGDFALDAAAGDLYQQGKKLKLQDQPSRVLQILLQRLGETVSRDELQQAIWPSDTFVDFDHGINNAIKRLREVLGDMAETPRYIETVPRRGYRFIGKIERERARFHSLAVLPLEDLSRDPDQEYFAEGLTEALITTLAKIGNLRVVSRTSSMLYKGVRKPLREIARELEVDAIVEGTVLRCGDRVRITAQLLDPEKENHLWVESYERYLRDVLDLQSEVAQAIARQVKVTLTPQEQANLTHVRRVDPEAYEAYLKGRHHWNRRSRDSLANAVRYFQEAIAKDTTYAAAYSGLADALSILGLWGLVSPERGCGRAKELALKALELDDSLAEAQTSFAWATFHYDYDSTVAERHFERAIELNPRYATAHLWFGMSLGMMGRYEEGYTESKRALRLDPHWSNIHFVSAVVHWCGHRYDRAIECCAKALELDPNSAQALAWLGVVQTSNSMIEQAIASLRKATQLSQRAPGVVAFLGEAYAAAGAQEEARKILAELTGQLHVPAYLVSRIYATLGQKDQALDWLDVAYHEHCEWTVMLKVDPHLENLHAEPRFKELVRRMNS